MDERSLHGGRSVIRYAPLRAARNTGGGQRRANSGTLARTQRTIGVSAIHAQPATHGVGMPEALFPVDSGPLVRCVLIVPSQPLRMRSS